MKKYILALTLCCFMLCANSVKAFPAESSTGIPVTEKFIISPLMDYISQTNANLYIDSNGVATVKSSVYGYQGITTQVEIRATLQQYKNNKWVTIKEFTAESHSHRTSLTNTHRITKGYSYRVHSTIKAYSGSSVELRTVTSGTVTY